MLLNSVDPALVILRTFRANSTIAICIPKHIPKKGILFCLAYLIAEIFPSVPLLPNPPGIRIPETFFNFSFILFDFKLSDSILIKFTFTLLSIPPWVKASSSDLYASFKFTYLPIIAMFIWVFVFKIISVIFFHGFKLAVLLELILILVTLQVP